MVLPKLLFIFLVVVHSQSEVIKTLPNFVTPCKISGSDLSKCYKENIEKLRSRLVKGIRELQILGFDPLNVTKMTLNRNVSASVSYSAIFTNFIIEGGKNFNIKDLKFDLENPSFKLKLHFPELVLKTDFVTTGVILGYTLKEPGNLTTDFNNVLITYTTEGKKITRNGNNYIDWNDGNVESIIDKLKFKVDGLFSDPNQLHLFNVALNENEKMLHSEVNLVLENSLGSYITEALRRMHKLFPLEILYSEN